MKTIYATAPADKPDGYAVYALNPVPYGTDEYIGWKMVKMKQKAALDDSGKQILGPDGKPQMLCVDDSDAKVTYDPHTQVLKQLDQTAHVAAKIGGAQAQLKVTVYKTDKAMAKIGGKLAQLQAATKNTDATKQEVIKMDFETISFFYGLGYLTPNIDPPNILVDS